MEFSFALPGVSQCKCEARCWLRGKCILLFARSVSRMDHTVPLGTKLVPSEHVWENEGSSGDERGERDEDILLSTEVVLLSVFPFKRHIGVHTTEVTNSPKLLPAFLSSCSLHTLSCSTQLSVSSKPSCSPVPHSSAETCGTLLSVFKVISVVKN